MTPHEILAAAAKTSTHQALAARLGYSRTAVTLYLQGRYPGGVKRFEAVIVDKLGGIECPFLGRNIPNAECTEYARRDCPSSSPFAVDHWRACQTCPQNHTRKLAHENA